MKKDKIQKLTLNQETLRTLTQEELNKVAGGVTGCCPAPSVCVRCVP